MSKRFLTLFAALMLITVVFSACSSQTPTTEPEPEIATLPASTAAPAVEKVKVLLLTEDPIGVNPYFITAQEGLNKAAEEYGVEVKTIECNGDPTNMDEQLRAAAREDYDLYILMTFGFNDTLLEIAPTQKDKFFVCVDCSLPADQLAALTNVQDAGFKTHETAYLLGIAAGYLTKTNVIGAVGPVEMPFMNRWITPFYEGAKSVNPNVTSLDTLWVGGWADPAKAKELSLTLSNKNADIIDGVAAGGNGGIFEAAQEKNFLTTGVDINECTSAPGYVIDSVLKRVDNLILNDVDAYLKGNLKSGAIDFGLKEGGTDLAVFTYPLAETKCVLADHPEIIEKIEVVRQQIIDGTLHIVDPMTGE
jgi:basic membrane protein A